MSSNFKAIIGNTSNALGLFIIGGMIWNQEHNTNILVFAAVLFIIGFSLLITSSIQAKKSGKAQSVLNIAGGILALIIFIYSIAKEDTFVEIGSSLSVIISIIGLNLNIYTDQ
jgi:hypothetical protein